MIARWLQIGRGPAKAPQAAGGDMRGAEGAVGWWLVSLAGWDGPLCFVIDACAQPDPVLSADPLRLGEPAAP